MTTAKQNIRTILKIANQPMRIERTIAVPITITGKAEVSKKSNNRCSMTERSFDIRFVILPRSAAFKQKDVRLLTFANISKAKDPLIFEEIIDELVNALCLKI